MPLRPISALAMLVAVGVVLVAPPQNLTAAEAPSLIGGGPLAFGPDGVLFIADNAGARIVALELGDVVPDKVGHAQPLQMAASLAR